MQNYLIVSMKTRMAYLRKPDDRKRGNPSKENRKSLPVAKPIMPAIPATILMPIGEDEASQLRHEKVLKTEMKKVNPNKQVVRELMKRSFFLRREKIVGGLGSVQDVLAYYPALKCADEVGY